MQASIPALASALQTATWASPIGWTVPEPTGSGASATPPVDLAAEKGEPQQISGKQELMENLINDAIFAGR